MVFTLLAGRYPLSHPWAGCLARPRVPGATPTLPQLRRAVHAPDAPALILLHQLSFPSVMPSSLSLRCKADRSMPMNVAVRDMLPEKRLIWMRRYSRSKLSRASRNGAPMIADCPMPSLAPLFVSSLGSMSNSMRPMRSPGASIIVRSITLRS